MSDMDELDEIVDQTRYTVSLTRPARSRKELLHRNRIAAITRDNRTHSLSTHYGNKNRRKPSLPKLKCLEQPE